MLATKNRLLGYAVVTAILLALIGLRSTDAAPEAAGTRWALTSPQKSWAETKENVQGRLTLEEPKAIDADGRCVLVPIVEIRNRIPGSSIEVRLNLQKLKLQIVDSRGETVETRGGPCSGPNYEWLYSMIPPEGYVGFDTLTLSIGSAPGSTSILSNAGDWDLPEGVYTLRGTAEITTGNSRALQDFLLPLEESWLKAPERTLRPKDIERTAMTIELEPVTFRILK